MKFLLYNFKYAVISKLQLEIENGRNSTVQTLILKYLLEDSSKKLALVFNFQQFISPNYAHLPKMKLGLPKFRLIFNIGIVINFGIHFQFRD